MSEELLIKQYKKLLHKIKKYYKKRLKKLNKWAIYELSSNFEQFIAQLYYLRDYLLLLYTIRNKDANEDTEFVSLVQTIAVYEEYVQINAELLNIAKQGKLAEDYKLTQEEELQVKQLYAKAEENWEEFCWAVAVYSKLWWLKDADLF